MQRDWSWIAIGACLAIWTWSAVARGQEPVQIPGALLNVVETVNVPATQDGVLRQVAIREGSVVQAEEVLAEIDSQRVALDLQEAQAQLEIARRKSDNDVDIRYAEKTFAVARAELERAQHANSLVPGAVSASEVDRLQLVLEKTGLEIEQARHNFEVAKLNEQLDRIKVEQRELALRQHTIRAPLAGMVVALNFRAGEWVRASEAVARIVRIDRLRIDDYVPVELGIAGLENAQVTFRPDLPALGDQEFAGRIVFVHPEINPVKAQMRIWAEIDNRNLQLRPGLQGTLTIQPAAR